MGRESMMTRADQHAKNLLFRDEVFDIDALIKDIEAITPQQICAVAKKIFSGKPTLAALGPLENLEDFSKTQDRLAA